MSKVICFGEVLWDVFPEHEKIGGAPLNVALRILSMGHEVSLISGVGKDQSGKKLLDFISDKGLTTDYIQINDEFETGKVTVTLNDKGSASYDINFPRAWDYIEINDELINLVKNSEAFVFGSLVTRNEVSKNTLLSLLDHASYKIFDLNLRPPHYTPEILIELMNAADFIKFNDDELYEVSAYLGSGYKGMEQNIKYVSEKTNTKRICVTKGGHGAVLLYDDTFFYNSGYLIKVKDTVGAGDSFLGTLISQLLGNKAPQKAIDYACAVGALVAGSEGANPSFSQSEIESFINPKHF